MNFKILKFIILLYGFTLFSCEHQEKEYLFSLDDCEDTFFEESFIPTVSERSFDCQLENLIFQGLNNDLHKLKVNHCNPSAYECLSYGDYVLQLRMANNGTLPISHQTQENIVQFLASRKECLDCLKDLWMSYATKEVLKEVSVRKVSEKLEKQLMKK